MERKHADEMERKHAREVEELKLQNRLLQAEIECLKRDRDRLYRQEGSLKAQVLLRTYARG